VLTKYIVSILIVYKQNRMALKWVKKTYSKLSLSHPNFFSTFVSMKKPLIKITELTKNFNHENNLRKKS
jgi:hypothetical protein